MPDELQPGLARTLDRIVRTHDNPHRCRFEPRENEEKRHPYNAGGVRLYCFNHKTYWCEDGRC